ncbi:hypothetical protein H257_00592 [Aphanomyces astaci]|uniref:Transposase Tc1-like domain-containing protein n=1 Tax=Aphanomyces astaci TaxID=112090 RepID=W4HCB7_APHAT|nr:hypothetical protein H257_00592 [Aphanomyces astaci]ETV89236.1 hypothetical protein H257_00592 [Aphanomyces astaci]|eukprot:XP_009821636.1 hypothetical protein H257_00592 [Aphanomyces astaci]
MPSTIPFSKDPQVAHCVVGTSWTLQSSSTVMHALFRACCIEEIEEIIRQVPHHDRQTLRSLAKKSGIAKTTIVRHMKDNPRLKARSSYVKPFLTPTNIEARLRFAMGFVRPLPNGTFSFISMDNYVHVDEKWFYLTKVNRRYYVYDDEEVAARTVKSKHFITKVMFLAAVARPRFDPHTRRVFDGKIGVWPFVEVVAAKRRSVNRD